MPSDSLRPVPASCPPLRGLLDPSAELRVVDGADPAVPIGGVCLDSRLVRPGDLYVGLPGQRAHGARFAGRAAAAGAVAVLTDAHGASLIEAPADRLPIAVHPDPRGAMAEVAARLYGRPATRLLTCAVTGTNGKTTTTFLLEAALRGVGRCTGVIGTNGFRIGERALAGDRTTVTTPESVDLQALLALMSEQGADSVAMEVSSHAMVLRRTEPVVFDVAAFTNLGRDHLDFHRTLDEYFEAKAQLFTPAHTRCAVINVDDVRGRELARRVAAAGAPALLRTGTGEDADVRLLSAVARPDQAQDVRLRVGGSELTFVLGLPGQYNAANAVSALAMVHALGLDVAAAAAGLAEARVPGRMQRLDLGPGAPSVVVDFAHTPQAIESALTALAGGARGRVIAVLGAGGDRDRAKRGPMGAAAAQGADIVIVTDDNPRTEAPDSIRAEVFAGAAEAGVAEVRDGGDRRSAIEAALRLADPSDTVAVLGKGHEQGQEVNGRSEPFDDAAVVAAAWARIAEEDTR